MKKNKMFKAARRSDFVLQIRSAMLDRGLTLSEIAQRADIKKKKARALLRGDKNLTIDEMYALSDAVGSPLVISLS